ncbi:MAG: hypothetical protein EOO01_41690 [Chitinophagaceae bacterium]|nr:MAG: hypothetical protein EOO01_41690 [Chitinophagaceae bacterium]
MSMNICLIRVVQNGSVISRFRSDRLVILPPMKKSANRGGTNADGSTSKTYCALCYQDGKFTQPDMTVSEMKHLSVEKMKKMKIPVLLAKFFAKGIVNLQRWKNP